MPGRTVEVKLFSNFSKIAKICNIFPNKGDVIKPFIVDEVLRLRMQFVHWFALYTGFPSIILSEVFKIGSKNQPQCIWTRIPFAGELQWHVTQISVLIISLKSLKTSTKLSHSFFKLLPQLFLIIFSEVITIYKRFLSISLRKVLTFFFFFFFGRIFLTAFKIF